MMALVLCSCFLGALLSAGRGVCCVVQSPEYHEWIATERVIAASARNLSWQEILAGKCGSSKNRGASGTLRGKTLLQGQRSFVLSLSPNPIFFSCRKGINKKEMENQ
mmetsp:Transcript_5891/g.13123  ORF Transcript_5891/g.13123 Transcript_5891/m.13123 type:complete len:107 (-) Transcript_5891:23-343(-)